MSEREELAGLGMFEVLADYFHEEQGWMGHGTSAESCGACRDIRAALSPWLDARLNNAKAEALAPVLALAEAHSCSRPDVCAAGGACRGPIPVADLHAALRAAAGTPTHDTTEEETP